MATSSFGSVKDIVRGEWSGSVLTGSARLSYEVGGSAFYLRPSATIDFIRVHQNAYDEVPTSPTNPYALSIDAASTMRLASSALLNVGRSFGGDTEPEPVSAFGAYRRVHRPALMVSERLCRLSLRARRRSL